MRSACFLPLLPVAASLALIAGRASAHPGSGIVVDGDGNVFVADVNTGLWKIDTDGTVGHVHQEAGHWLALDAAGSFARVDFTKSDHWPRWFKRRTPDGAKPALLTDGGSPLVVHRDGNLYYAGSGGAEPGRTRGDPTRPRRDARPRRRRPRHDLRAARRDQGPGGRPGRGGVRLLPEGGPEDHGRRDGHDARGPGGRGRLRQRPPAGGAGGSTAAPEGVGRRRRGRCTRRPPAAAAS